MFLGRLGDDTSSYGPKITEGLRFCKFGSDLPPNPRIFIKPNLTFPTYRPGVMTSPETVEAVIIALREFTSDLWIGDADSGGYNRFSMDEVYSATGLIDFTKKYGVSVVNLSNLERETIQVQVRRKSVDVRLPVLLTREIDCLVTVPVPKIHMNTGVSLTFKNQWGCIPEPEDRLRLHPYFSEVVVAVNQAVKAKLAIIDGRYGLNRSGPLRGDAVRLDWIAVASDIGAGARVATHLMQVPLERVAHLRYAKRLGLIPDLNQIEVNKALDDFLGPAFFLKRHWTDYPGLLAFRSLPFAHLAYFSRAAGFLHRLLYRFREPFY